MKNTIIILIIASSVLSQAFDQNDNNRGNSLTKFNVHSKNKEVSQVLVAIPTTTHKSSSEEDEESWSEIEKENKKKYINEMQSKYGDKIFNGNISRSSFATPCTQGYTKIENGVCMKKE